MLLSIALLLLCLWLSIRHRRPYARYKMADVVVVDGRVTMIKDSSGNRRHLRQRVGHLQPLFKDGVIVFNNDDGTFLRTGK